MKNDKNTELLSRLCFNIPLLVSIILFIPTFEVCLKYNHISIFIISILLIFITDYKACKDLGNITLFDRFSLSIIIAILIQLFSGVFIALLLWCINLFFENILHSDFHINYQLSNWSGEFTISLFVFSLFPVSAKEILLK